MMNLSCYKPGKGRTPSNFFAVPDEDFSTGLVTGIKVFREIMEIMKTDGENHSCHIRLIIEAMGEDGRRKFGRKGRQGATWGVSDLMAEALLFFSKNANFKPWLDGKLAEAEQSKVFFDGREAKHKTEFVARMKAAKAAKIRNAAQDAMCVGVTV